MDSFIGGGSDSESGLFYNGNRYYNPAIGRYISSDPIGLDGGLNTFLYAEASPVMYDDPEGLQAAIACAAGPNPVCAVGIGQIAIGAVVGAGAGAAASHIGNSKLCNIPGSGFIGFLCSISGGPDEEEWPTPLPAVDDVCIVGHSKESDTVQPDKMSKCIEQCSPILERPKRFPGDDSNTWDFHKCVNDCMLK